MYKGINNKKCNKYFKKLIYFPKGICARDFLNPASIVSIFYHILSK